MSLTSALAIYFVIWWIVLFAVLPWGVRSQAENGEIVPGSEPGAPTIPHLGRKMLWNTVVSALVFGLFYFAYTRQMVSLDDLGTLWGFLQPPLVR